VPTSTGSRAPLLHNGHKIFGCTLGFLPVPLIPHLPGAKADGYFGVRICAAPLVGLGRRASVRVTLGTGATPHANLTSGRHAHQGARCADVGYFDGSTGSIPVTPTLTGPRASR
jgi:hypothetical protein